MWGKFASIKNYNNNINNNNSSDNNNNNDNDNDDDEKKKEEEEMEEKEEEKEKSLFGTHTLVHVENLLHLFHLYFRECKYNFRNCKMYFRIVRWISKNEQSILEFWILES